MLFSIPVMVRLVTLFAVSFWTGYAQADNGQLRVITYGTSLTASGRWQRDLQSELQRCWARDVAVLNKASNGKDSTWGLGNVAAVANAHVAIVEFAINDAIPSRGLDVEVSRAQTKAIVAAIKSSQPNARIFLMITHMARGSQADSRPRLADYYQMYRDLAAEGVAGLFDAQQEWSKIPDSEIPDGVHPSIAAHRAVTVPVIVRVLAPDCL